MKKFLLFLFLMMFTFSSPARCDETVLHGSVQYTVESARKMAFEGIDLKLDKKLLEEYLIDENNKENREAIKKGIQINGRTLMSFVMAKGMVKGYALVYDEKPEYVFYYSTSGYLIAVDIDKKFNEDVFPYKVGKYNPVTGNLVSIGVYVSEEEQYVYNKNGKLKAHWVGNIGYNEKGRPIATRAVVDELPETDGLPQINKLK